MKMKLVRLCCRPQEAILLTLLAILLILPGACTTYPVTPQSPEPEGTAPVIHDLKAPKQVAPSSNSPILCVATSDSGDVLSYEWSATGGQIQGEGDSAIWIATDTTGDYTVTVVVTDGKGDKATGSVNITVTLKPNRPPVVNSMRCQDCSNGIEASRWKTYYIVCDASDPEGDELNYSWLATIGKIEGEGDHVVFRTFGEYGNALITVIVTDDKGNKAEGYLAINISCCH